MLSIVSADDSGGAGFAMSAVDRSMSPLKESRVFAASFISRSWSWSGVGRLSAAVTVLSGISVGSPMLSGTCSGVVAFVTLVGGGGGSRVVVFELPVSFSVLQFLNVLVVLVQLLVFSFLGMSGYQLLLVHSQNPCSS